jgi:Ca-activated chloride channel family protein
VKKLILLLCFSSSIAVLGQKPGSNGTNHILILLDGSGSMLEQWKGTTKWDIAKKLLSQTLDSIEQNDPSVEIGLRVFGHQSPNALMDCKDSKLEVPIGKKTASQIKTSLQNITPKGNTPIAYSLFLAAGDFVSQGGVNSIILITDGIESCEGDPCASSQALRNKKITLKPFIIGLGLAEGDKDKFDCVGSYYDATDAVTFKNAMNIVISQATNSTTVQVNLIDAFGQPAENNIELLFYDDFSKELRYTFVHTLNIKDQPDTLYLDPVGKYNIIAQTTPPVTLQHVELLPGKHNIIGIEVPQGTLQLTETGNNTFSDVQAVIRNPQTGEILNVQNFNTKFKYITGIYDIEVLTLPRLQYKNVEIRPGQENSISVDLPGVLSINSKDDIILSIFTEQSGMLEKIYETSITDPIEVALLPGEYTVLYRSNTKKRTEFTKEAKVIIKSSKTYALLL